MKINSLLILGCVVASVWAWQQDPAFAERNLVFSLSNLEKGRVWTLLVALFVHGNVLHLFGNMIYLWTFGDAVEDTFGHTKYLLFFVACGVAGSLIHTLVFPRSVIPSIGASGSIAGILGAFLVLRPRARIVTLFPLVVYWAMAEIPAALFLPVWFLLQFFNGAASLAAARATEEVAGVAWWAHVGGFVFGAAVAAVYRIASRRDGL